MIPFLSLLRLNDTLYNISLFLFFVFRFFAFSFPFSFLVCDFVRLDGYVTLLLLLDVL